MILNANGFQASEGVKPIPIEEQVSGIIMLKKSKLQKTDGKTGGEHAQLLFLPVLDGIHIAKEKTISLFGLLQIIAYLCEINKQVDKSRVPLQALLSQALESIK